MKALIAVFLSISLAACGGGDDDDAPAFDGILLTPEARAALDLRCMGHGSVTSIRTVMTVEPDGNHRYLRATCSDGTIVQIEV